jgi:hypothetical protein
MNPQLRARLDIEAKKRSIAVSELARFCCSNFCLISGKLPGEEVLSDFMRAYPQPNPTSVSKEGKQE